jgi:hypothetical protein
MNIIWICFLISNFVLQFMNCQEETLLLKQIDSYIKPSSPLFSPLKINVISANGTTLLIHSSQQVRCVMIMHYVSRSFMSFSHAFLVWCICFSVGHVENMIWTCHNYALIQIFYVLYACFSDCICMLR